MSTRQHFLRSRLTFMLFIALFACTFNSSAHAARTVQLEWRVISASHKKGNVDPRLKDIYQNLGAIFNYNSYRLVNMNRLALSPAQQVSVPLSRNKTFVIKVTRVTNQWVHVQIQLLKGDQSIFGTAVRLMNGRTLLIGGPSDHGKILIFSLRSFW